jgi:hypothetical protein
VELSPVNLIVALVGDISQKVHWFRGGFPTALTSSSDKQFSLWAENFIRAYIERDLGLLFDILADESLTN